MVLFSFPTSGNISWPFMVVTVLFLLVYYFGWRAGTFKGPRSMGDSRAAHRDRAGVRARGRQGRAGLTPERSIMLDGPAGPAGRPVDPTAPERSRR